jgi:hypothetical protein
MEEQKPKKNFYKRWWFWVLVILVIGTMGGSNSPQNNIQKSSSENNKQTTQEETPAQKSITPQNEIPPEKTTGDPAKAQKELDELIDLAKNARLVTSYEFSNKASVVYIDNVWYTQTVTFKKDFMAKIAMLKKQITGYNHFEVRDIYSNEKVAEVTAFSNSLEVYR